MIDVDFSNLCSPNWKEELKPANKYIFSCVNEIITDHEKEQIDYVVSTYPEYKYHIVVNTSCSYEHSNITQIDFFALQAFIYMKVNSYSTLWKYDTNKILYLMGKPYKFHRLGLLYVLLEKFGPDLVYSFDPGRKSLEMGYEIFEALDIPIDYKKFAEQSARDLDFEYKQCRLENQIYETSHYSGYPYDHNLYKDTVMSIVSETMFNNKQHEILTEKTWRPIINHHPFLFVGPLHCHLRLKDYNFELWHGPLYRTKNTQQWLNLAIIAVEEIIDEINTKPQLTKEKIKHNFENFLKVSRFYYDKLAEICDPVWFVKESSYPNDITHREIIHKL